jgi:hypothetical protein
MEATQSTFRKTLTAFLSQRREEEEREEEERG